MLPGQRTIRPGACPAGCCALRTGFPICVRSWRRKAGGVVTPGTLQPPVRRGRLGGQEPPPTGQSTDPVRQDCSSAGQPPVRELAPVCHAVPETHTPAPHRETTLLLDPLPRAPMPLSCLLQLRFLSKEAPSEYFPEWSRGIHRAATAAAGSWPRDELARTGDLTPMRAGGARGGAGGRPQGQARRKQRKAEEPPAREAGTRIGGVRRARFFAIPPAGFECRCGELAAATRSEGTRRSRQQDVR